MKGNPILDLEVTVLLQMDKVALIVKVAHLILMQLVQQEVDIQQLRKVEHLINFQA